MKNLIKSLFLMRVVHRKERFNLNINKIYNKSNWKPSISIWDGISLLIQEVKFENNPTLEQFTKRIRSLYK